MIKRSVLFCIALVLLYAAYVTYANPMPVAQHQWQENVIRAQQFSYTDSLKKKDVVLGTSLTAMMDPATLPGDTYMLAYPGLSVVNGLETLSENKVAPKYVFIEQNAVLRPVNKGFDEYVFGNINFYSKKYFPFMRDCYQPAGQAAVFTERHGTPRIQWVSDHFVNQLYGIFQGDTVATIDKEAHYRELRRRRNLVDTAELIKSFDLLKAKVSQLEQNGSKIYFFETPTHPEVFACKQRTAVMDAFKKYFPAGKYHYLPTPDISQYTQLHDELHLDKPSAVKYAAVLSSQINEVRKR